MCKGIGLPAMVYSALHVVDPVLVGDELTHIKPARSVDSCKIDAALRINYVFELVYLIFVHTLKILSVGLVSILHVLSERLRKVKQLLQVFKHQRLLFLWKFVANLLSENVESLSFQ